MLHCCQSLLHLFLATAAGNMYRKFVTFGHVVLRCDRTYMQSDMHRR